MPPVRTNHGRASKACHACRTHKTRCYATGPEPMTCLRCRTLGKDCSLQRESLTRDSLEAFEAVATQSPSVDNDASRILSLEHTVQRLESILAQAQQPAALQQSLVLPGTDTEHAAAPLQVIRDADTNSTYPRQARDPTHEANIVQKNIVSAEESDRLLALFQRHYGRWLSISETMLSTLRSTDIKDALFLCAACSVAARHSLTDVNAGLSSILSAEAERLLASNVLQPQRPLTFFQATLVLSLWSSAVGQSPTGLDVWLMTGMAIQHGSISKSVKDVATGKIQVIKEETQVDCLYLWNHLCLSHLHACITMRRKAMINAAHIRQARLVTSMPSTSNFELRMAAELCLYWTIYGELDTEPLDLEHAQMAIQSWKSEWNFLFEQERHHFLQMGCSFAQLLILERALGKSSEAVDESSIVQMVQYCSDILQAAIRTPDDRTEHLTHHVYHMITFAALTLIRLLRKYEKEFASFFEAVSRHALILEVSQWLRSIGLPGHIGQTMGNIVATLHQSSFPAQASDIAISSQGEFVFDNFAAMPEFFDLDANFDWDTLQ
ncbi:hypothetical protein D6C91_00942 [Aureobasidium pullulans]|uniref:Transcriptional activator of proteases prtT n=1 Tax=Aureobasidium pullulans TaxID=5580 RepID=A0A4S9TZH1_AURPU|nr:hypothetical protein D6C91_00942 [Aureobasidium pullulans]